MRRAVQQAAAERRPLGMDGRLDEPVAQPVTEPVTPADRPASTTLSRRSWLATTLAVAAGGAALPALSGCGGDSTGGPAAQAAGVELVASHRTRAAGDPRSRGPAAASVQDFGADLFRAAAAGRPGNVVMSPLSLHVVLAMAALGARGGTQAEMLRVLHATGAGPLASGLNALTTHVNSLAGSFPQGDGEPAQVRLGLADSVWGQRGTSWAPAYLDTLATEFGAGLRAVDFQDPQNRERARVAINEWVSQQTKATIRELIAPGVLQSTARLVLANALYLKAPWREPFGPGRTADGPFTRLDGSTVTVPFMHASLTTVCARGNGWQAARVPYAGRLAMTVVLPDAGRFAAVAGALSGDVLRATLADGRTSAVDVALPRWRARSTLSAKDALETLGMRLAFTDAADLGAMTTDATPLQVAAVLHQGFIAVDEKGTEASAASAVVVGLTAAPAEPLTVRLDRPFLYIVHDVEEGTPLFVGQVTDPSAAA
jgi:serpin B